jgi:LmbE family N-acetylglucosaminyl deacetylase
VSNQLKLMAVLAHPDDESLGIGGTLAKYAAEGIATYLITATRGERGRFCDAKESPDPRIVGKTREGELLAAAKELGLREVQFLDYRDTELDQVDPREASGKIAAHLRRVQPHVVITFGPEGAYGHPDHIAISQLTTAAVVCAADPDFQAPGGFSQALAHRVSKLYYMAWPKDKWDAYQGALKTLKSRVDGVERQVNPWPDWAVTTIIDTSAFARTAWRAISCHKTQMATYKKLEHLPEEQHRALWGSQEFYRVFSLVNGGRKRETDLFEGLRPSDGRET